MEGRPLDLAVIGAGAAGTFVARAVKRARPDWTVELFERTQRVGGRLFSVALPGIEHPIELGGMRFITSHERVVRVVDELGLPTHPFDRTGGEERTYLRGRFGGGANDSSTGAGYALAEDERGLSPNELFLRVVERVLPGAAAMDHAAFVRARASATYLGRPIVDWAIYEAFASVLSLEAHRYLVDAFGYDSGVRAFNVGDELEFLLGGGDPRAEARTPDAGMDAIPRGLADAFRGAGGVIRLGAELTSLHGDAASVTLRFSDGAAVRARRAVVAITIPALRLLAASSPALAGGPWDPLLASVDGFPAMKLYLGYPRPWWRPAVPGIRTTTDLTARKVFYVDTADDRPAALLAMYTDGRDVDPWVPLSGGRHGGGPAVEPLLAEIQRQLVELHPGIDAIPQPAISAFQHWGADPHELGWTFWRPGFRSDELIPLSIRPDPELPVYLAGETFSRNQSWVDGALQTAELVVERLLAE